MACILIADDEKNIRNGLAEYLKLEGYDTQLALDGSAAWQLVETKHIDMAIIDLRMPKLSGEALLGKMTATYPTIPVVVLTGHGTVDNAVMAMRSGAYDFITKPVNLERLGLLIKRALNKRQLSKDYANLQEKFKKLQSQKNDTDMIGNSLAMQNVLKTIDQVADTNASVLITGDSGVGKELVAEALHKKSSVHAGPLIKVHCAALSESLLESELFGHEKGAFTGSTGQRKGRFELANNGSMFLDEIGEINQSVQIKILRVLQEKEFERVGGEKTIHTNTRIIAATNKNLYEETTKGNFREDLYYRLNVISIHVPPLRERREDITLLTNAFVKNAALANKRTVEGVSAKAMKSLYNYDWPGNIRELQNAIESAVVMTKGNTIELTDLPQHIFKHSKENEILIQLGSSIRDVEAKLILKTIEYANGNKSKAAEILNIGRKTLHRKIYEYNLQDILLNK